MFSVVKILGLQLCSYFEVLDKVLKWLNNCNGTHLIGLLEATF